MATYISTRYGVILSNDKEYLKRCLREIEKMVEKYKLRLNRKTKIINVSKEGLDFLGFRFCIYNKVILKVRRDTKKRFKRKMKLSKNGKFSDEQSLHIFNSYKGHLKWGNCFNLIKRTLQEL